jgi:hypothetical protein
MSNAPNSTSTLRCDSPEILAFMASIQAAKNKDFDEKFSSLEKPLYVCDRGSKFLAIDVISHPSKVGMLDANGRPEYTGRSVFCFIAATDSESKSLGKVKRGDILKAAGYKAPAKHVRGSILSADPTSGVGLYGANYIR